jgi:phytoene dehydrogenase-like protein
MNGSANSSCANRLSSNSSAKVTPGGQQEGASKRAVVIGAGFGGLAVAGRLQANGYNVVVFEQAERIGGKLGLFERDGYRFDTGPSIVTLPEVYRNLWKALGADFDAEITLRPLDPIARYRFGDGSWLDASADDETFAANVEKLRPGNSVELGAFMSRAEAIWNATRGPFLEQPLNGPKAFLRLARKVGDLRTIAPWRTMRSLSRSYLADERLVTFVDRYATYTGSDPRKAPAALTSIPFVERHFGGWYVEGGLVRLGELLAKRCVELGVEIRCATPVSSILTETQRAISGIGREQSRCCGVLLANGEKVSADVVVANADAHHVYADLVAGPMLEERSSVSAKGGANRPGKFVAQFRAPKNVGVQAVSGVRAKALRGLQSAQPSLSGLVLCCAVKGRTPNLAHHTVLFPEHYDEEFDDLFGAKPRLVRNPTIYASVPDDPLVAPPGCEAWFILVNAPRHSPDDAAAGIDWNTPGLADEYADRILRVMADRGIDIRSRIVFRELRTPAELEHRTRAFGGSIYGTSSNGPRAAFLRPRNQSPIRGLYLVGGSSHPGGGLPLVTLSAQIVSELILGH